MLTVNADIESEYLAFIIQFYRAYAHIIEHKDKLSCVVIILRGEVHKGKETVGCLTTLTKIAENRHGGRNKKNEMMLCHVSTARVRNQLKLTIHPPTPLTAHQSQTLYQIVEGPRPVVFQARPRCKQPRELRAHGHMKKAGVQTQKGLRVIKTVEASAAGVA